MVIQKTLDSHTLRARYDELDSHALRARYDELDSHALRARYDVQLTPWRVHGFYFLRTAFSWMTNLY